jgi:hypothetical protein
MSDLTALDHRHDGAIGICRTVVETPKGGRGGFACDAGVPIGE